MKIKLLVISFFGLISANSNAQHFGLYHTGTLYDTFENPSHRAFIPDSSRRIGFNFLIPNGGFNAAAKGPATSIVDRLIDDGKLDASKIDPASKVPNKVFVSQNVYLLMLRVFVAQQYNKELGFSWQIKSDGDVNVSNGTLAILHNYKLFDPNQANENLFNNDGSAISYHQFSLTYRENYNRRLAFGAKLSYLSGIAYSKLNIERSDISINAATNTFNASVVGFYKSSFLFNQKEAISLKPGFRNPGFATTLSANYRTRSGWYFLGNAKDLGIIRWTKNSYFYNFNDQITVRDAGAPGANERLRKEIEKGILTDSITSPIYSLIKGKAEVLISRDLNNYHPKLILSKNLFYSGGNIALVNTYQVNNWGFSLLSNYDLRNSFMLGAQLLYKSPNFDFFLGSDQLLKTSKLATTIMNEGSNLGSNNLGASAYFGLGIKFGRILERNQTSNTVYGVKNIEYGGFLKRVFSKKEGNEESTGKEKDKLKNEGAAEK